MRRSKLYKSQLSTVEENRYYEILDALNALKAMPQPKFNQTIEVAFKLGIDPRKSDQTVRGAIPLPKGTGKDVTVCVIATGTEAEEAKTAGADVVGMEDVIEKIKGGWLGFDVLIATPDAMRQVRPLGRQLGPRGLMPNPKTGTVTEQTANAVKEAKAGRVEFRADRGACIHVPIGKISFKAEDLVENFEAVLHAIEAAKPATAKGIYMQSCAASATMSPSVKINLKEFAR